jgi:hypothetical protein
MPYWHGFRQISPSPPGHWVGAGPYKTYAAAKSAYERGKLAPDAQVSPPFEAKDQTEADGILNGRGRDDNSG